MSTPHITQVYECPKHGQHDATMHVRITDWAERVFCMKCYVDALEKIGVKEMQPATPDKR